MRAVVYAAAIALLLSGGATAATEASAQARQQERRENQCRYQWLDRGTWTAREERRTALCVLDRWPVSGGWTQFRTTISCESGWSRLAYNSAGPYVGLGQHALTAWPSRLAAYSPPLWNLNPGWRNSRTMLTVTIRMAHSVGWGPWTCA